MSNKFISSPIAPTIPAELEEFRLGKIDPDEWLDVDEAVASEIDFTGVQKLRIEHSRLNGAMLSSLALDKFEVSNAEFTKIELTGLRSYKASVTKAVFSDSRATGADFAEGYFEDCVFKNMKFDEAGFRMASFKRVRFENCVLSKADFYEAKLAHVIFENCTLEETNFNKAVCSAVDLRGEDLSLVKGIVGLKGAFISEEQLIQIAPLLAHELGFRVN